jgi:hypothetical protein
MNFDFNYLVKKCVLDVCTEIKKDDNMEIIKNDILNPVIEHVIFQITPYFLKVLISIIILIIVLIILFFLNLRIIYK